MTAVVEKLRRIWTPDSEVEEVVAELSPQTQMDSLIRDWLHRVCEQNGPQTVLLGMGEDLLPTTGMLNFSIVTYEPRPGKSGQREVTIWVEDAVEDPPLIPDVMQAVYPVSKREPGRGKSRLARRARRS